MSTNKTLVQCLQYDNVLLLRIEMSGEEIEL